MRPRNHCPPPSVTDLTTAPERTSEYDFVDVGIHASEIFGMLQWTLKWKPEEEFRVGLLCLLAVRTLSRLHTSDRSGSRSHLQILDLWRGVRA